jgi:hypothetical protein
MSVVDNSRRAFHSTHASFSARLRPYSSALAPIETLFHPQSATINVMSDQKPEASKATDPNGAGPFTATDQTAKPPLEQLGALEEDDEFEVGVNDGDGDGVGRRSQGGLTYH